MSSLPLAIGVLNGTTQGSALLAGSGEFENPFFVGPDGQRREAFAYFRDTDLEKVPVGKQVLDSGHVSVAITGPSSEMK
ncbi:MAG: hypothetical protein EOO18_13710 [Chryseobacterium sp.]|nr:MAG: hypothetical protein EOO18_13710 [Chryseobacterium sp.]